MKMIDVLLAEMDQEAHSTTYLRMHDVLLPSVYGPTADENPFAPAAAPVSA